MGVLYLKLLLIRPICETFELNKNKTESLTAVSYGQHSLFTVSG